MYIVRSCHGKRLGVRHGKLLQVDEINLQSEADLVLINDSNIVDREINLNGIIANIYFLDDASIAFRSEGRFLCAEHASFDVGFTRDRLGPWEKFYFEALPISVVPANINSAYTFREGNGDIEFVSKFPSAVETWGNPTNVSHADLVYFMQAPKFFFKTFPGENRLPNNHIVCGKNIVLSSRFLAHGTLMDRTGFYHNAGFLFLRNDMDDVLLGVDKLYINFKNIESRSIKGIFCSPFDGNSNNYYHWLLEGMLSLHMMLKEGINVPPVIVYDRRGLSQWQVDYLKLVGVSGYLGIDGSLNDAIQFDQLYWLEKRDLPDIPATAFISMRDAMIARLPSSLGSTASKVYIKRPNGTRSVTNSTDVEAMLHERGFQTVILEELTVQQQISVFRSASIIIAVHGAGLANIVFCRAGTLLIELMPDNSDYRTCFWCLAEKLSITYTFIRCSNPSGYAGPVNIDLSDLAHALETKA